MVHLCSKDQVIYINALQIYFLAYYDLQACQFNISIVKKLIHIVPKFLHF